MNIVFVRHLLMLASISLLTACSVAKLEARLEANPQCKDAVNPKTGALLPCPGSDKAFYREAGLAPAKPTTDANSLPKTTSGIVAAPSLTQGTSSIETTPVAVSSEKTMPAQVDCKPQIHKKTGGTLPCPAPD